MKYCYYPGLELRTVRNCTKLWWNINKRESGLRGGYFWSEHFMFIREVIEQANIPLWLGWSVGRTVGWSTIKLCNSYYLTVIEYYANTKNGDLRKSKLSSAKICQQTANFPVAIKRHDKLCFKGVCWQQLHRYHLCSVTIALQFCLFNNMLMINISC